MTANLRTRSVTVVTLGGKPHMKWCLETEETPISLTDRYRTIPPGPTAHVTMGGWMAPSLAGRPKLHPWTRRPNRRCHPRNHVSSVERKGPDTSPRSCSRLGHLSRLVGACRHTFKTRARHKKRGGMKDKSGAFLVQCSTQFPALLGPWHSSVMAVFTREYFCQRSWLRP